MLLLLSSQCYQAVLLQVHNDEVVENVDAKVLNVCPIDKQSIHRHGNFIVDVLDDRRSRDLRCRRAIVTAQRGR